MARVLRATLLGPHGYEKDVALKQIRLDGPTPERSAIEALINEARVGGRLRHPNIVETWEFGQEDSSWFIAMELVDGLTLRDLLAGLRARRTRLPVPAALEIVGEVCRGLHYAHTLQDDAGQPLQLIHRDLKPSNVMLSRDGRVKVLDFGIAKGAANLFHTQGTSLKGTPCYMSPEQLQGDPLDARSDVFAVGALLFELASGERLVDSPEPAALVFRIVTGKLRERAHELDELLPGLGGLIARCLELERDARWPDARTLGHALDELRPASWGRLPGLRDLGPALVEIADGAAGDAVRRCAERAVVAPVETGWPAPAEALNAPDPEGDPLQASRKAIPLDDTAGLPSSWLTSADHPAEESLRPPPEAPAPARTRPWLMPAALTAVLLVVGGWIALGPGPDRVVPTEAPRPPVADVLLEVIEDARGGSTRVRFLDGFGNVIHEELQTGKAEGEDLAWLGTDGDMEWVAVSTRGGGHEQRRGLVRLYDVRDGVRVHYERRSADLHLTSPEQHRGFLDSGRWTFRRPSLLPADEGPPDLLTVAADLHYAAGWIVRLDPAGERVASVFHPGRIEGALLTGDDRMFIWASANRQCGDRPLGCTPYNYAIWTLPVPARGTDEALPPSCDGLPEVAWSHGWLVDGRRWRSRGGDLHLDAAEPFVTVRFNPARGSAVPKECGMRLSFTPEGSYLNALSNGSHCPDVTPPTPIQRDHAELCAALLEQFPPK